MLEISPFAPDQFLCQGCCTEFGLFESRRRSESVGVRSIGPRKSRSTARKSISSKKPDRLFYLRQYIHVLDPSTYYFPAQVVGIENDKVLVTFIGWGSESDEMIDSNSNRIVAFKPECIDLIDSFENDQLPTPNASPTKPTKQYLVSDTKNFYFIGRVVSFRGNEIEIKYDSWCTKSNEWLFLDDDRLCELGPEEEIDKVDHTKKINTNRRVSSRKFLSFDSDAVFHPGLYLHIKDKSKYHFPAIVIKVEFGKILVHFLGWGVETDEWIDSNSKRIVVSDSQSQHQNTEIQKESKKIPASSLIGKEYLVSDTKLFYYTARVISTLDNKIEIEYDHWCNKSNEWLESNDDRIYECPLKPEDPNPEKSDTGPKIISKYSTRGIISETTSFGSIAEYDKFSVYGFSENRIVAIFDSSGIPWKAKMKKLVRGKILFNYDEWGPEYDEWINSDSKRIKYCQDQELPNIEIFQNIDLDNTTSLEEISGRQIYCNRCKKKLKAFRYYIR
jgi:hypothetical protein